MKWKGRLRIGVLLFQDNVPIHTVQVAVAEADNYEFELLPHSPYSPDLGPPDFLFLKLKFTLCGRHFGNNDEVICTVGEFFEDQDAILFCNWIEMLEHHWPSALISRIGWLVVLFYVWTLFESLNTELNFKQFSLV